MGDFVGGGLRGRCRQQGGRWHRCPLTEDGDAAVALHQGIVLVLGGGDFERSVLVDDQPGPAGA
eukprot:scaffold31840_cov140-Isochrysis_galbana.AAC.2